MTAKLDAYLCGWENGLLGLDPVCECEPCTTYSADWKRGFCDGWDRGTKRWSKS